MKSRNAKASKTRQMFFAMLSTNTMTQIQSTIRQRGIDVKSVKIPRELLDEVDARLLGKFGFRTRSEIVNEAIRAILLKYTVFQARRVKESSGVAVHVFRDGEEIQLNIVDENSSTILVFSTDAEFEKFRKEIVNFKAGD